MTQSDQDNSFIAEALPAFISEAHEQIERLEQLLLELEDAPDDRDLLDALFRCAHTVKGSAGIFGLDAVVAFTHHVETLLDRVRDGQVALTPALSTLLLQCNDQMRRLVADAQHPEDEDADAQARRGALVARLQAACAMAGARPRRPRLRRRRRTPRPRVSARWQVAVHFGADTFRNGMDPLAILNYLRGLGEIAALHCDAGAVPPLDRLDPEQLPPGLRRSCSTRRSRARPSTRPSASCVTTARCTSARPPGPATARRTTSRRPPPQPRPTPRASRSSASPPTPRRRRRPALHPRAGRPPGRRDQPAGRARDRQRRAPRCWRARRGRAR